MVQGAASTGVSIFGAPGPPSSTAPTVKTHAAAAKPPPKIPATSTTTTTPSDTPPLTERRTNDPLPMNSTANPVELNHLVYNTQGKISGVAGGNLVPSRNDTKLYRGAIWEHDGSWHGGPPFGLKFCFNPTDITINYDLGTGRNYWPPGTETDVMKGTKVANARTVTMTLLFDRTYEVWRGDAGSRAWQSDWGLSNDSFGPGTYGALWDARSAERLIGIYDANPDAPGLVSILDFQFTRAGEQSPDRPNDLFPINFTGWISSLTILFSRFDMNMTPTRCEMSIGATVQMRTPDDLKTAGDKLNPNAPTDPGAGTRGPPDPNSTRPQPASTSPGTSATGSHNYTRV